MTELPKRVTTYENESVDGLALCGAKIYNDKIDSMRELRERQDAYRESLPTDPKAAILGAMKLLRQDEEQDLPKGLKHALHLSFALEAMVKNDDFNSITQWQESACYIAQKIADVVQDTVETVYDVTDILGNPSM